MTWLAGRQAVGWKRRQAGRQNGGEDQSREAELRGAGEQSEGMIKVYAEQTNTQEHMHNSKHKNDINQSINQLLFPDS